MARRPVDGGNSFRSFHSAPVEKKRQRMMQLVDVVIIFDGLMRSEKKERLFSCFVSRIARDSVAKKKD